MQRSRCPSAQKEEPVGVFRTLLIQDGIIHHYEKQIKRLIHDAKQLGLSYHEQKIVIPKTISRLKIIVTRHGTSHEIKPYSGFQPKILTLYPEPVEGAHVKTFQYLNRQFIRDYAHTQGCDDALILTKEGYITEVSNANFFYEYEGENVTACPSLPYLKGLTIERLPNLKFAKFRLQDIPEGSKCYICNSLMGVVDVKLKRPS